MFLFSTLALSVLRTFTCDSLDESFVTWYDCTFVTPYILAESDTDSIFSLSRLANLPHNKGGTFPCGSQLSLLFSSAQCAYKVKTFLYHGYYDKQTQRTLHCTNIITVVKLIS